MEISPYRQCAKRHNQEVEEFKKHEICARPIRGKTCPGDSGSPAIDTITHHVIGLTSFGKGGCDVNHIVGFVKIIDNLDFIEGIMNEGGTKHSSDDSNDDCDGR